MNANPPAPDVSVLLTNRYGCDALRNVLVYAWQYTVKMLVRWLRYVVASGSAKKEKRKLMLNAWYAIRYSLAPWK